VSAQDERGIGGFDRIMGPNGQAQYYAQDVGEAYSILFEYYRFAYRLPGEARPRRAPTTDRADRSVMGHPVEGSAEFRSVGEILSSASNAERKKPFPIRAVMQAVVDQDGGFLERFGALRDGEHAVVWDAHLGGYPVTLIGIESQPMPRRGPVPMDGPSSWTGGTLFPQSSRKVARALNAASGSRPVVVLANLSGFDGSPESLRKLQLEYGAEIGRAVVNFKGPIIFVVVGRYHGGAYVVFSKALNAGLRSLALEGTYASVIGGAPAAAVVFPQVVRARVERDPRIVAAREALAQAEQDRLPGLREALDALTTDVMLEKRGELAREFDAIHSVERAVMVGSLDRIIRPEELRSALIEEVARGW
jgi:acetyl-CoA carboxylase carboxyltransferase component